MPKKGKLIEVHKRPVRKGSGGITEKVHIPYTSKISFKFLNEVKQFLREVRVELKKVNWPSRKETVASTSVVIILVLLVAIFLGLIDLGLSKFVSRVMH